MTMLTAQKEDPFEPPCVIEWLPFRDYLEIPAASSHALGTLLNKSPLHMRVGLDKPSAAKGLGTLVHALLLTPDRIDDEIAIKPENADKTSNTTKSNLIAWLLDQTDEVDPPVDPNLAWGKQLDAKIAILEPILKASGKTICTQEQMDSAQRMRDNVLAKDIGKVLFDSGRAEVTMMAIDPKTELICKIRCDWLPTGHDVIVDLKTAASASFEEFSRASARFGYDVQASFYRHIYREATGTKLPAFLHVVVESEPPYDCAFWELDEESLLAGEKKFTRALAIWERCERSGNWPGIGYDYDSAEYVIEKLSLPRWAL